MSFQNVSAPNEQPRFVDSSIFSRKTMSGNSSSEGKSPVRRKKAQSRIQRRTSFILYHRSRPYRLSPDLSVQKNNYIFLIFLIYRPKIQRLVTPIRLQRRRHLRSLKNRRLDVQKAQRKEYETLIAKRLADRKAKVAAIKASHKKWVLSYLYHFRNDLDADLGWENRTA